MKPKNEVRVLFVDDDRVWRDCYTSCLESVGYSQIRKVESGEEALEVLSSGYASDLIFMDTKMKGVDSGPDFCRAIRKEEHGKNTGIIGMSSHPEYQELWEGAGADDFFDKHMFSDFEELDRRIQKVLEKYQAG
jgi:CheY-like chemotaxis protein